MLVDCEVLGMYVVGAGGSGTRYYVCTLVCVLCLLIAGWKRPVFFLGVHRIGEARQFMNLISLKLLQFFFPHNSRISDRRDIFYETHFAFLDIR